MKAAVEDLESSQHGVQAFAASIAVTKPRMTPEERRQLGIKRLLQMRSTLSFAFQAPGVPVTFAAVGYRVTSNSNRRVKVTLLDDVTGYLQSGTLTALMGPSGSGKTTLLDVLAGRKTVGTVEGDIRYAGKPPTPAFLRRATGYVEQHDTLIDNLTVEEMLMYTAELKRPVDESQEEKKDAVDELIERLGLETCRNVCIGSPMARGISGGQAKRTNIGVALVTSPSVLFLDEPTSGLDSYTATAKETHKGVTEEGVTDDPPPSVVVISAVKSLAVMGITVAATIHSPSSFCFQLFDQLLLLVRGKVVYFGPNGKAAVDYFNNLCTCTGGLDLPKLTEGENPAEWVVDLTTQVDWQGRTDELVQAFDNSSLKGLAVAEIAELQVQPRQRARRGSRVLRDQTASQGIVTPFWWGLFILLKYRALKNYRTLVYMAPRAGAPFLFAIILFTLFWKLGDNLDPDNLFNITQMLFIWSLLSGYVAITYIPSIVLERPLFMRERNDGMYNVSTYLCAKMVEELTILFIVGLACSNLVFWTVRLQGQYVLVFLVEFCTLSVGVVLAYFVAAISPNMDIANALLPVYLTVCLLFMGLVLRWESIPWYWRWVGYVDFLRYAWGALMKNQFGATDVEVFPDLTILEYYSLDGISKWAWLGFEACFFVIFYLCAFLSLKYVRHGRR